MRQPLASPFADFAFGTAQSIGAEWMELFKQGYDDCTLTLERLAACRDPSDALAIQAGFARRATDRCLAHCVAFGDLTGTFAGHMAGFGPGRGA